MTDARTLWTGCATSLREQVSEATWKTWFEAISPVESDEDHLTLAVPSSLVKERLEGRYLSLIEHAVAAASARPMAIRLEVHTDAFSAAPGDEPHGNAVPASTAAYARPASATIGVDAVAAPRMAAGQPPGGEPAAQAGAVALEGFGGIGGARRPVAARRRTAGAGRLVKADASEQHPRGNRGPHRPCRACSASDSFDCNSPCVIGTASGAAPIR